MLNGQSSLFQIYRGRGGGGGSRWGIHLKQKLPPIIVTAGSRRAYRK